MNILLIKWKFKHWLFQWKKDADGDIAFVIANKLAFVKYKESTLIYWNRKDLTKAGKHQGNAFE